MSEEVSVLRLYVMRCMYLLNFVLVGSGVWVSFIHRQKPWDPITGVAFSFWAVLAGLSALGIRYPLAMLPVIFMQLGIGIFIFRSPLDPKNGARVAEILLPWGYPWETGNPAEWRIDGKGRVMLDPR